MTESTLTQKPTRRRVWIAVAGVAGVAVLAALGSLYLTLVPGHVAGGFEERAQRGHAQARAALEIVYRTFGRRTFEVSVGGTLGASEARLPASASPARRIAAAERDEAAEKRRLERVRGAIRDARDALDAAAPDMTHVDAPFLLGGSGPMREAAERAARERRYLSEARAFLGEYNAVVGFAVSALDYYGAQVMLDAREDEEFTAFLSHDNLRRLAAGLDRIADSRETTIDAFADRTVPASARALHRAQLRIDREHLRASRALVDALRAGDSKRVRQVFQDEIASLERTGGVLSRAFDDFIERSSLRDAIPGVIDDGSESQYTAI